MSSEVSAEAVVLRRFDTGEADRRLVLLTRDLGKVDVVAKGARKPGSRLAGSSDPLVKAHFTWAEGRFRKFVTQVQPVTSYPRIRHDYDLSLAALALAELVAVSLPFESPQEGSQGVFELVVQSLDHLESGGDWKAALLWAESKLLEAEGLHPSWTACAVSGEALAENPAWVSPSAGGYVCQAHAGPFGDRFPVPAEALIALKKLVGLEAPPGVVKRADEGLRTLFRFWRHALENRLPAHEAIENGLSNGGS